MTTVLRPRSHHHRRRVPVALAAVLLASYTGAVAPAGARGGGGGEEVRVTGSCGSGADAKLRLRSRDGAIRVTFEIDHARRRSSWRVVLVRDRRVVWRGPAGTGAAGSFEIERRLRDLPGADGVSARAWGPRGVTCTAAATLPG